MQFLMALLDHPVVMLVLLMFFMGFMGMTYEFVLRLFGKKPFLDTPGENGGSVPPEPANVPKPPTDPDRELVGENEIPDGAEEVENEDGSTSVVYTYESSMPDDAYLRIEGDKVDIVDDKGLKV